jgi:MFS family permease
LQIAQLALRSRNGGLDVRNRWWIAAASLTAQLVGSGAINVFAFAVFLKPVANDLGVGRGVLSSALLMSTLMTAVGCLAFGVLFDRIRIRTTLLIAVTFYAVSIGALSLLRPSLAIIYTFFALSGFFGSGQTPLGYSKLIAQWFDKDRGLAMGIIQAGVGLGGIFVAQWARFLIATFGWREAYVGMGITIFIIAFVPVAIFLREPDPVVAAASNPSEAPRNNSAQVGPTASEVLRTSWQFWLLAIAFFLVVVTANGPLIHAVALLTDRGISIQRATAALSAAGLAMIAGRMLAGYCLDKFHGPYVAVVSVAGAMVGLGLLISPAGGLVPIAGTVLCGLGMGAEGDIVPYFVSRYFGLRAFGQIYGYLFAVFMVGVGVGPSLLGFSFDRWHSYAPMFLIFEAALFLACILFLRLGPYRFRVDDQPASHDEMVPTPGTSPSTIPGAARP